MTKRSKSRTFLPLAGIALLLMPLLVSCSRGRGQWGIGYPGGLSLSFPFSIRPGGKLPSIRRKNKDLFEPTPPLEEVRDELILPAFENDLILGCLSWLRASFPEVEDPWVQCALAFGYLEAKDVRYHMGPNEMKRIAGEKVTLDSVLPPGQVLSLKRAEREDLVVILATILHGWGGQPGLAILDGDELRLLLRRDEGDGVLVINPISLSKNGFFAACQIEEAWSKESAKEVLWLEESAEVELPSSVASTTALCEKLMGRVAEWELQGDDPVASRVLNSFPSCN